MRIVLATCLSVLVSACSVKNDSSLKLIAQWQVTEIVASAPIVGLDENESTAILGRLLFVKKDRLEFLGETCHYKEVIPAEKSIAAFLNEYALDQAIENELDGATLMNIACEGDFVLDHIVVSEERVWFVWYCVLLEARKAGPA
ncbi:hypothetical protein [Limnobacter sp.]|uniref:hypothetical protein n=1 Tax=Limnobacter sp. TaxID=2003368 RepID=UPI0035120762